MHQILKVGKGGGPWVECSRRVCSQPSVWRWCIGTAAFWSPPGRGQTLVVIWCKSHPDTITDHFDHYQESKAVVMVLGVVVVVVMVMVVVMEMEVDLCIKISLGSHAK